MPDGPIEYGQDESEELIPGILEDDFDETFDSVLAWGGFYDDEWEE